MNTALENGQLCPGPEANGGTQRESPKLAAEEAATTLRGLNSGSEVQEPSSIIPRAEPRYLQQIHPACLCINKRSGTRLTWCFRFCP